MLGSQRRLGPWFVAALVILASTAAPARPDGSRSYAHTFPPWDGLPAEAGEGWDSALRADRARRAARVAGLPGDLAAWLERWHTIRVHEALIERFPEPAGRVVAAYREIARQYDELDQESLRAETLLELARKHSNHPEALRALGSLLDDDHTPLRVGRAAADLVEVLDRCDDVDVPAALLRKAFRVRFRAALAIDRDLRGAERALERRARLATSPEDRLSLELDRAALLTAAGRGSEALARLDGLAGRLEGVFGEESRPLDALEELEERLHERRQGLRPYVPTLHDPAARRLMRRGGRRGAPLDAATLRDWLGDPRAVRKVLEVAPGRHASVWRIVERGLREAGPPAEDAPGDRRAAPPPAQAGVAEGSLAAVMRLYRARPFAPAAHRALLRLGERLLREGRAGFATAAFGDVLRHRPSAESSAAARRGRWLALAQTGAVSELEAVRSSIEPGARIAWRGRPVDARAFLERLIALARGSAPAEPARSLLVDVRTLRLPSPQTWPLASFDEDPDAIAHLPHGGVAMWRHGEAVVAGAPGGLAVYDASTGALRWERRIPVTRNRQRALRDTRDAPEPRTVPGRYAPAFTDDAVIAPWGFDDERARSRDLVAFELRSGRMRWAASDDPGWSRRHPVGTPAVAGGRVYTLTVGSGRFARLALVCLDGASGRWQWERELTSRSLALRTPLGRRDDTQLDLVSYGSGVTVREGAVYCATQLGVVARVDARDGAIDWVTTYDRVESTEDGGLPFVIDREGAGPVVTGERVLVFPRDRSGGFALDRTSGEVVWDRAILPAERVLGTFAGRTLLWGDGRLTAIEPREGATAWEREVAGGTTARRQRRGRGIVVAGPGAWHLVDALDGRIVARREVSVDEPWEVLPLRERTWVLDRGPRGFARRNASRDRPASGQGLLVLEDELRRSNPALLRPPGERDAKGDAPDAAYVLSGGASLERIEGTADGLRVAWRRAVDPGVKEVAWAEGVLLLRYAHRIVAIDRVSGRRRWRYVHPKRIELLAPAGRRIVAGYQHPYWDSLVAGLDARTGEVLWRRDLKGHPAERIQFPGAYWGGTHLHLLGLARYGVEDGQASFDLALDPGTGDAVAAGWLLPAVPGADTRAVDFDPDRFRQTGGLVAIYSRRERLHLVELGGERPRGIGPFRLEDWERSRYGGMDLRRRGRWAQVIQRWWRDDARALRWVVDLRERRIALHREDRATWRIVGDLAYGRTGEGPRAALAVHDLRRGQRRAAWDFPQGLEYVPRALLDVRPVEDGLRVTSRARHRAAWDADDGDWEEGPRRLRVDLFAPDGAQRAGQVLGGVAVAFDTPRTALGDRWLVAPPDGLRLYRPGEAPQDAGRGSGADASTLRVATRREPVTLDGSLDEWRPSERLALPSAEDADRSADGTDGDAPVRVYAAYDAGEERLYLAVDHAAAEAFPYRGQGFGAGGDWLELALGLAGWAEVRLGLGAGPGGLRRQVLAAGDRAERLLPQAAFTHHAAEGRAAYELAIDGIRPEHLEPGRRQLLLSAALWKESAAGGVQPRRHEIVGGAIRGSTVLRAAHADLRRARGGEPGGDRTPAPASD